MKKYFSNNYQIKMH